MSCFGYYFRSCNQLYLNYPLAIISSIKECAADIFKIVHDMHDDLIVVEKNLRYGFVISEDEYEYLSIEYLSIEYWGV